MTDPDDELLASLNPDDREVLYHASPHYAVFARSQVARLVALGLAEYGEPWGDNGLFCRADLTPEGRRVRKAYVQLRRAMDPL